MIFFQKEHGDVMRISYKSIRVVLYKKRKEIKKKRKIVVQFTTFIS